MILLRKLHSSSLHLNATSFSHYNAFRLHRMSHGRNLNYFVACSEANVEDVFDSESHYLFFQVATGSTVAVCHCVLSFCIRRFIQSLTRHDSCIIRVNERILAKPLSSTNEKKSIEFFPHKSIVIGKAFIKCSQMFARI